MTVCPGTIEITCQALLNNEVLRWYLDQKVVAVYAYRNGDSYPHNISTHPGSYVTILQASQLDSGRWNFSSVFIVNLTSLEQVRNISCGSSTNNATIDTFVTIKCKLKYVMYKVM